MTATQMQKTTERPGINQLSADFPSLITVEQENTPAALSRQKAKQDAEKYLRNYRHFGTPNWQPQTVTA